MCKTKYPIVISIKYRIDYMSRRTILTEKLQFLNFFAILLMQFHYRRLTFLQLFFVLASEVFFRENDFTEKSDDCIAYFLYRKF